MGVRINGCKQNIGWNSIPIFGTRNAGCVSPTAPPLPDWSKHANGAQNTLRIGEVSDPGAGALFPRNYSGDFTMDEMQLFRIFTEWGETAGAIQNEVKQLGDLAVQVYIEGGRYYRPTSDAVFTSGPIHFKTKPRTLVPAGAASVGTMTGVSGASSAPSMRGGGMTTSEGPNKVRILGMAWTWHADDYSRNDGKPFVYDYGYWGSSGGGGGGGNNGGGKGSSSDFDSKFESGMQQQGSTPNVMEFCPETNRWAGKALKQDWSMCSIVLRVLTGTGVAKMEIAGPTGLGFTDAGFTRTIDQSTGLPYMQVDSTDALQYDVNFKIQGLHDKSILHASPAFDDITFYFAEGDAEYLAWRVVNTTL